MITMTHLKIGSILFLFPLLFATGCVNLGPKEVPIHYYVLGGEGVPRNTVREGLEGLTIGLRQPEIASYLDMPFILTRRGTHRVDFSEYNRWGERLDRGINRTVAAYLAARPSIERVDVVPWPRNVQYDYLVEIHVLRFEGIEPVTTIPPVPGTVRGDVHLLATWEIIDPAQGGVVDRGTTEYRQEGWIVGDYENLVAHLDVALQTLAADLHTRILQL